MQTRDAIALFLRSRTARGLSKRTNQFYSYCLNPLAALFDDLPTHPDQLDEYLAGLTTLNAESRYDVWRALRTLYKFVHDRRGVPNAAAAIARPKRPKPRPKALTEAQVHVLNSLPLSRRDRAIITLLLDTGIRLGELHTLTGSQIGSTTIEVSGKTGPRTLPISPTAKRALINVPLPWRGPKGDLTLNGLYLVIRRALRAAGVAKAGPHALRHTFAVHFVRAGGNIVTLQIVKLWGHHT